MTPSVPSVAVSSSRPVPKPATAPKTEPRRSAIESSATSTMLAVRNGLYSVSTASWRSEATKRRSAALTPSISRFGHQHDHRLQRREVDERLHLDLLERVDVVVARRSRPCRSGSRAGTSTAARRAPSEPAVITVSPTPTYGAFETRSRTSTSLPPPPRWTIADRRRVRQVGRGDGALAVGEQRHARDARSHACRRCRRAPAAVITTLPGRDAVVDAGGDRDALVDRALRIREDRGADPVEVARSTAAPGSSAACLQLHVLLHGRLVLDHLLAQRARPAGGASCSRTSRRRGRASSRPRRGTAARRGRRRPRTAAGSPAAVPCTPSSALERNETVIRTSESSTRPPTMIRRLRALERLEG